jgi:hypothetical protein
MIDLNRLQALDDEQLADELDAMVDAAIAKKVKGPSDLVEICGLVPLLTQRLRRGAQFIELPRLER